MDKVDYKNKYKELYLPKRLPELIKVPTMNFIMIDGTGNPNNKAGEYEKAVELLYGLSYTIKMSVKGDQKPEGYFEYVVPPLEGLWWLADNNCMDFTQKDNYGWTSMIRQPEFVTEEVFRWACQEVRKKKPQLDITKARFETLEEGLCVQILHIGPYDEEPQTISKIEDYIKKQHLENDISAILPNGKIRRHHEIYLSDPRKAKPEKMKTVIRHPVRLCF